MKINDIVLVDDSSYSMSLLKGALKHVSVIGGLLQQRRWRVLSCSGVYPTDGSHSTSGTNDIMLVDVEDPDYVVFTQERFCRVTMPASSPPVPVQRKFVVPHGTKEVRLILQ